MGQHVIFDRASRDITETDGKKREREREKKKEADKTQGQNILKSRGCVTQAAKLLALPPNQKGYRIAGALSFFFFCSPACSCCGSAEEAAWAAEVMVVGCATTASSREIADAERGDHGLRGHAAGGASTCTHALVWMIPRCSS
jgi:hypothetical protein